MLGARAHLQIELWKETVLLVILAVSEIIVESVFQHLYPKQSMTQVWLLLIYPLILLSFQHLLFSKLRFYYWKIAACLVVVYILLEQTLATFVSFLGFVQRPVLFEFLLFLGCRILNWCP